MKHYNVKILMTALLSTAFSLTAGAQGYYAYATGDYLNIEMNSATTPTGVSNISITYGGHGETYNTDKVDSWTTTGGSSGEANYTPEDSNPKFAKYCKGNGNTPKWYNGSSYKDYDKTHKPEYGTYYIFNPTSSGTLTLYIYINATVGDKTLWISEMSGDNCVPISAYPDGQAFAKRDARYYSNVEFNVEAGKTYYVFASGTSLGLAGFIYLTNAVKFDATSNYSYPGTAYTAFQLNNRSFVKDKWNTICLPVALVAADITYIFGAGTELAAINANADVTEGGVFKFTTKTTISAGTPFLIKPKKDVYDPIILATLTETTATKKGAAEKGFFWGTYSPVAFTAGDNTKWFMNGSGELSSASVDGNIGGFRAYFEIPSSASARPMAIFDDGETTDISELLAPQEQIANSVIYNLNGQRMSSMSSELPSGIYIVNGKKVFIK